MFVSIRKRFRKGDNGWAQYTSFVELPELSEVRSIDSALNRYAAGSGDIECWPETLTKSVEELPIPKENDEYCMLAINLDADPRGYVPKGWKLLGHDLADETQTSSLLNCGPWKGQLRQFMERLNDVGLLSRSDAVLAQQWIPREWGEGMDHTHVAVWAVYEQEACLSAED